MTRIFVNESAVMVEKAAAPLPGAARLLAGIAGTLPVALLLSVALALLLPSPMTRGLRIGSCALVPIWGAAASCTLLARCARDAWISLLCIAALAALLSGSVLILEHALAHGAAYWAHG